MLTAIAQTLSALIAIAVTCNTLAVFHGMVEGTDERNSVPYLVINAVIAIGCWYIYVFANYLM